MPRTSTRLGRQRALSASYWLRIGLQGTPWVPIESLLGPYGVPIGFLLDLYGSFLVPMGHYWGKL